MGIFFDSKEYTSLSSKLYNYTNSYDKSNIGSKEYLPTKSDLDNLSEKELIKFKEKEIGGSIYHTKSSLKLNEEIVRDWPSSMHNENFEEQKAKVEEIKDQLRYIDEFLEALEAGGLREKSSEEKVSKEKEDPISLINKKDGSAVTYFLNQTIDNQDEVIVFRDYCNTLFHLLEFFTLKRTPVGDDFDYVDNFLEGLTFEYEVEQDVAEAEVPDEVNNYISNGQMESELNEEHFKILKDGIHKLCVTTQNEFDTLSRYLGFSDTETHTHLTYILYSKNNPKMAAIQLKVDDSELDILYKEFSQLLNEDELNTLYENAEKYRTEYIEELVEKVNKERTKRLDYENYSVDLSAYLMLASNYALDESIAVRLKGKALIQEILDQKIADDDAEEGEAKKYLEWF
jgi:hypothetical protein